MSHIRLVTEDFVPPKNAQSVSDKEAQHMNDLMDIADRIVESIFQKYPLHEDRVFIIEALVSSAIESFCLPEYYK